MAIYEKTIEVWGRLPFPMDMLRYDVCVPATGVDAARIEDSITRSNVFQIDPDKPIRLRCFASNKRWVPTSKRWESFGWVATVAP